MIISKYMDINRIEFIVTYKCSGKCKHCSIGKEIDNIEKSKYIKGNYACEAIRKLSKLYNISSVMTFGGEPLLFSSEVCKIHKCANDLGIQSRQLITNGFFTNNNEYCNQIIESLGSSGVNDLLISVDAFHQETIPFENVYRFAKYAKEVIPNTMLHPAWVVNKQHDNFYNTRTKDILIKFDDLMIPISKGNNIFMAGRAVENLCEYYEKPKLNLSDSCGLLPYTDRPDKITSITIVPCGNVMVCDFVIGNIYEQNIEDIILSYNPYKNKYLNALLTGGAGKLIEISNKNGIFIDISQCYSVCDLCHKICNQMKSN